MLALVGLGHIAAWEGMRCESEQKNHGGRIPVDIAEGVVGGHFGFDAHIGPINTPGPTHYVTLPVFGPPTSATQDRGGALVNGTTRAAV